METFLAIVVAAVLVPLVLLGSILVYALTGFTLPLILGQRPGKAAGNRGSVPSASGESDVPRERAATAASPQSAHRRPGPLLRSSELFLPGGPAG